MTFYLPLHFVHTFIRSLLVLFLPRHSKCLRVLLRSSIDCWIILWFLILLWVNRRLPMQDVPTSSGKYLQGSWILHQTGPDVLTSHNTVPVAVASKGTRWGRLNFCCGIRAYSFGNQLSRGNFPLYKASSVFHFSQLSISSSSPTSLPLHTNASIPNSYINKHPLLGSLLRFRETLTIIDSLSTTPRRSIVNKQTALLVRVRLCSRAAF